MTVIGEIKNKRKIILIICILCILIISSVAYAKHISVDKSTQSSTEQIEEFIKKAIDKGKISGLAVAIVENGETIYEKGFGYADIEEQTPVTSATLFEIGSNSKAFTGLGILKLIKDGLININDPITKYIPWLQTKYEGKTASITIEQLLHQTSGIPFNSIDKIPQLEGNNALEETVRTLVNQELDTMPGENFQYATINYDVLGLLIEKVTGMSYEGYMTENVFKVMKLEETYLNRDEIKNLDIATGYKMQFFEPHEYIAPTYDGNKPAGYIISNLNDMEKWLNIQLCVSKESSFSTELIKQSQEVNRKVKPTSRGASYADGWFVYQEGGGELSHGGENPNYSSYIILRPEEKIGIVVLSNINSGYTSIIADGINDILRGNEPKDYVKDQNIILDKAAVIIIYVVGLLIIFILWAMIKLFRKLIKDRLSFDRINVKDMLKIIISLCFMSIIYYCIYKIPYIFFNGISWNFVFVWRPNDLKYALYLIYLCIGLSYIYVLITRFCKKKDDSPILFLVLLSVVSGLGNSLIILTINHAVISTQEMKDGLLIYFLLGMVLYIYGQKILRVTLVNYAAEMVYSKRMKIISELLYTSYSQFEKIEQGVIQSTLNNDTETVSRFANILISGLTSAITLVICFIYLGFLNFNALLLSLMIILLISIIYYFTGKYANKIGEQSRNLQNIFYKFIDDLIGGYKELSLNIKKKVEFKDDLEVSCNEYKKKKTESELAFSKMFIIGELLFTIAIFSIVFIFPHLLKSLEYDSLSSYVFILLYMTGPVHSILNTIPSIIEVRISIKRINNLQALVRITNNNEQQKSYKYKQNIILELKDIEYQYGNLMENERNFKIGPISCKFQSGEIIFIIGGNGSGKSTLAKLLTGLYIPQKGSIEINGKEISASNLSELYTTVFSDFYLFDKLYGTKYNGNEELIKKYLKILQLDKKVKIENGMFSTTKLSTGQRKRLALLITYLEDKPIYLFDEWAADQDPEFRKFFYNVLILELKQQGKCIIAITHDDYYYDIADKILKMNFGKIKMENYILD